jgi:lipoyl(octanoyl) transferase
MRAELRFLGRTTLADAVARQKHALARLVDGTGPPTVFVTEHDPVYTVGRAGVNRKVAEGDPARYPSVHDASLPVVELDRGGDVTWHGPGQVVVYPVLPLKRLRLSLVGYLRALERAAIEALADHGVTAYARRGLTGIWVRTPEGNDAKIGAIGIACRRWITYHGLSINVACDLAAFDAITPCGIEGVRVARVVDLLDKPPMMEKLAREVAKLLAREGGLTLAKVPNSPPGAAATGGGQRCGSAEARDVSLLC